jgi:excisionase family DNA binding protein
LSARRRPGRGTTALAQALERRLELVSKGMLSINEAVEYSGFSRSFLYDRMTDGSIPYVATEGRRLIPKMAMDEWLADHLELR